MSKTIGCVHNSLLTALRILEGLGAVKFKTKPNFKGLQARQVVGAPKNGHSRTLPCGENVMEVFRAIKQRLEIAKSVSRAEALKLFTETKTNGVLRMDLLLGSQWCLR